MAQQGDPNYPVYLGLRASVRQVFEDTDAGWTSLSTGKHDRAVTTEATKLYFNWLQTGNVDAFTTLVNAGNTRAGNERQSLQNLANANNTTSAAALAGLGTEVRANRASARSRALEAGLRTPTGRCAGAPHSRSRASSRPVHAWSCSSSLPRPAGASREDVQP
jgi:hypothetical protein